MARRWIQRAKADGGIKEGAFTAKANAAGKSVAEYADEKASAPGVLGKEARLAKAFEGMHHGKGRAEKRYGKK